MSKLITQICQSTDIKPWYKGLFLGWMVLKMLAEHLVLTSSVSFRKTQLYEVSKKPCSALMLCIQAVSSVAIFITIISFNIHRSIILLFFLRWENSRFPRAKMANSYRQIGAIMSLPRHCQKIKKDQPRRGSSDMPPYSSHTITLFQMNIGQQLWMVRHATTW